MEPHTTIAEWDGDPTLYDKSQWVDNVRSEIAHVFDFRCSLVTVPVIAAIVLTATTALVCHALAAVCMVVACRQTSSGLRTVIISADL
jgi:CO/xanthine dehydrogenase Mo-binding subunit